MLGAAPPSKPLDRRICRCWRRWLLVVVELEVPSALVPARGTEMPRPPGLEGMLRLPLDRTRRWARFNASERRLLPDIPAVAFAAAAPALRPPGESGGMCRPPPGEMGGRRYEEDEAGGGENRGDVG